MNKLVVEVYASNNCSICGLAKEIDCILCKEAREIVGRVNTEIPFQFKEVDIGVSDELRRKYMKDIPTVFINGKKAFKFKVDENEFRKKVRKEIIKAGIMRLWNKKQHYS